MISEFFVSLFLSVVGWLGGLFPTWEPPDEFFELAGAMQSLMDSFAGLGVWVDFAVVAACLLTQIVAWAAVLGTKLIRAVISHIPAFGGSGD